MILVDTNVLVWLIMGDQRLKARSRSLIDRAWASGGLYFSAVTPWEVSMLVAKNRLDLDREVSSWFDTLVSTEGVYLAPLTVAIGVDAGRLPGEIHGDPADRIIVATARNLGCPVAATDSKILAYGKQGHVGVLDARR